MPLLDVPISSAKQDQLSRSEAAERCAATLTSIRSDSAFVVGLSGPWGSGKTSFVNMVKEALRTPNSETIVLSFNAWLYSSHEQLLKQFFSEVSKKVGESAAKQLGTTAVKELGAVLDEYADKITEVSFNLASMGFPQLVVVNTVAPDAVKAGKGLLTRGVRKVGMALKGSEKTIEQMRADISERLAKLDENIVVIIDDVDRLPQEDIRAIFKLVNLTASFPRMTYLLSYDAGVVRKALSDIQGISGADYLEKIVQVPIDLPQPPADAFQKQLEETLAPYLESTTYRFSSSERVRLLQMFEPLVMRRIETPRQVKRYLNKFEVMRAEVRDEVCPVDVIAMVAVLLFYPSVASWLWRHRDGVCTAQQPMLDLKGTKAADLMESLQEAIAEDDAGVIATLDALSALFPKVAQARHVSQGVTPKVSRETGRVAHISNLELVYRSSDGLAVRRAALYHLTFDAGVEEFVEGLRRLDEMDELTRAVETIEESLPELSRDRKIVLSHSLLIIQGKLKQDWGEGFLFRNPNEKIAHLLSSLLQDVGIGASDSLVERAAAKYSLKDYTGISWFLRDERVRQAGESQQPCLSSSCYSALAHKYIDTIVANYPSVLCMSDHPAKFLWRYLDTALGEEAAERMSAQYANDVVVRILYAASSLARWSSSGGSDGYGYDPSEKQSYEPVFRMPSMEEIEMFSKTVRFWSLPDAVKSRVASLYLILRDGAFDQVTGERSATSDRAFELLAEWQGSGAGSA